MSVVADNKSGIGTDGAVHKFIVIGVGCYQAPVEIDRNRLNVWHGKDRFRYVFCYFRRIKSRQYLEIFIQYFGRVTQRERAFAKRFPHQRIFRILWQNHQQAIRVEYDFHCL